MPQYPVMPVTTPAVSATAPLSRRRFLIATTAATLAAGCATPGSQRARPLVGTQLYGWGQYAERAGQRLDDHQDETLAAIRDCGYDYAEGSLDAAHPENNAQFAERLRARGLQPVSLYTGGAFHTPALAEQTVGQLAAAASVCRDAGFQVLVCNPDPLGRDKTDAELRVQAAALQQLGIELKKSGLHLGLHHHTPELRNGGREFHSNFRHSQPGEVGFCYDVHWVYRGGVPPAAALRDYGERVVSWHLRQSRDQIWWEDLAPGDIDYEVIARFAQEHQLPPRYTVELALESGTKITRGVVENHRRSREYVKRVFGV